MITRLDVSRLCCQTTRSNVYFIIKNSSPVAENLQSLDFITESFLESRNNIGEFSVLEYRRIYIEGIKRSET